MIHIPPIRRLTTLANRIQLGMVSLSVPDATILHRAAGLCAKPGAIFLEFAAGWGFSTLCILDAIGHVGSMRFITSEMAGDCWVALRDLLHGKPVELWEGDARLREWPDFKVDFLSIDSDHEPTTTDWYLGTLFPLVKPGGMIAVHDVLDPTCKPYLNELAEVEKAMAKHHLQVIELMSKEEEQELAGMLPWPRSHFGVRRACNTLVMRRMN